MRTLETLSGGEWVATGEWIGVQNPADVRTPIARVPALAAKDVTRAYDHAERGFAVWKRTSPFERARVFTEAARLIRERVEEIAADVTAENGKTLAEATGETLKAADFLEYYAGLARQGYGTLLHDVRPNHRTHTQREPIGVILVISPWNDPLITPARKLAPLLAVGNAAVFKPATETPLSGLHFARALHDAGLPAGVLNVVTGRTAEIEEALLDDPRIVGITFTGSNAVGNRIRRRLADRNVRFQGELGGKNASVVLRDADLPTAAKAVVAASFGQAGQRCTATSRVIVERPVYEEFTRLLVTEVEALRIGPGSDPATTLCPLSSPKQRDSVLADLNRAVEQGATVLTGGSADTEGERAHGCYVRPTVLADVTPETAIWREEVFGPVVALLAVEDFASAVEAVNDSDFGLAAAVFTRDLASAYRFADEAECGQIAVNTTTPGWDVHLPFGGFRDSGTGYKEQGEEVLKFSTRVKTVAINLGEAVRG
ncbi:aldehyde dehydrogenase family protein [Streptomyces cylindrosporus]|uniref:Aldehyde dehydrogenase family protein n=1 Tax=Streptomyces cylindrosporus TaxID=2927583 RepID=A0ABS9YLI8_9ACTN|nr:aldehyde dehydrogenase family protein [Streptomyces cylindrosporus]MCI3278135.1 aldehyde dehydrogenase family protein [Streptomyces cylindrosporus]